MHETVEIDHRRQGHEEAAPFTDWAERILAAHGPRSTALHVTWRGEAGHGTGPTRRFFDKVAAELESPESNGAPRIWRDAAAAAAEGLFPAPLPDPVFDPAGRAAAMRRLRLVGLFMGKALQQRQMPGLCLAKPLFRLLLGEKVSFEDVGDLDPGLAHGVRQVMQWQRVKSEALGDEGLHGSERCEKLREVEAKLLLLERGSGEPVTCHNLDQYVEELKADCVARFDIPEQVAAIREGLSLVLPWRRLRVFSAEELQQLLWSDLAWDAAKLERIVRAGPSWPQDRPQITWLRDHMLRMDACRRRALVKFVTASVCMPLDDRPIVVHPQVSALGVGKEESDAKLPTSRTCHNYLYLPPYSAPSVLEQRLDLAIWEERIVFD